MILDKETIKKIRKDEKIKTLIMMLTKASLASENMFLRYINETNPSKKKKLEKDYDLYQEIEHQLSASLLKEYES